LGARVALFLAAAFFFHSPLVFAGDGFAPALAGGWAAASLQDEAVVKAARFAVHEQARRSGAELRLLSVKHARQQVVAGINYSMNLMVQGEGKHHLVIAVVWVKPNGDMELTRWHWV
jgi:hypothetical protein